MLLTSIDPFFQELERQFDQIARGSAYTALHSAVPMDGIRRSNEVVLRFDLPGVDPDSIEVTVERGVLSVSARRDSDIGQDEQLFVRERPVGTFTRRIRLSDQLDTAQVQAGYHHGVLTVRIPVPEQAQPRRVAIQHGDVKAIDAG